MDDWQQDELRAIVRAALEKHDEVAEVQSGPRHNEATVHLTDGRLRVIAIHVRDHV